MSILDKLHGEVVFRLIGCTESQRLIGYHLIGVTAGNLLHQNVTRDVLLKAVEFNTPLEHTCIHRIVEGQHPRLVGIVGTTTLVGDIIYRHFCRTNKRLTVGDGQR